MEHSMEVKSLYLPTFKTNEYFILSGKIIIK